MINNYYQTKLFFLPSKNDDVVLVEVDNWLKFLFESVGDNATGFSSAIVGNAWTTDKRYSDGSRRGICPSKVCSSSVFFWRRR